MNSNVQKTKAEARLGILGYLDPKLQVSNPGSKLKESMGWQLRSLSGLPARKTPVRSNPSLNYIIESLQLSTKEVCKLEKGAYGLIDAPYQWYLAISEEPVKLGLVQNPFDPCQFALRHHATGNFEMKGFAAVVNTFPRNSTHRQKTQAIHLHWN